MSLLSPAIAEVSVEATAALAAASTEASSSGPGFAPTAVDPTCAMNRSDGNRTSPFGVETQAGRSPVGIGPFAAQAQRTSASVALFIDVSSMARRAEQYHCRSCVRRLTTHPARRDCAP